MIGNMAGRQWDGLLSLLILHALIVIIAGQGKYSSEKNTQAKIRDIKTPFRMAKVNLVWQKAIKRLSPSTQEELYVDLKIHDKLEMEVKRIMTDGLDIDGEQEAQARDKLREILLRYGLLEHFGNKDENETFLDRKLGDKKDSHMQKMDKKVAKLWKKAQLSGFSDEEMADLKREFLHHEQRMDEYQTLKNEIDALGGMSDNSIDGFKKVEYDLKERKQLNSEMKTKHRQLKEDYERLERLSRSPSSAYDFTEPSVIDLWIMAKKANFSAEELDSLKVELAHFEHKIKKHAHYEDQVRLSKDSLLGKGKSNHIPVKHEQLEQKTNDYGYKVKKHHREIKKRISKQMGIHYEL